MKNLLLLILLIITTTLSAQFKEESNKPVDIRGSIINNQPSSMMLGFINPENFSMSHSISMSYTSLGNQGIALGVYTNSIFYKFNNELNIQVDASLVNSPYSSYGTNFSDQINGIYLSRVQLNYQPTENMYFSVMFGNSPFGYYSPNNFFYSPFRSNHFIQEDVPEK